MKERVMITLDSDLLEKLDKKAGLIPRSTYINEMIRKEVEKDNKK